MVESAGPELCRKRGFRVIAWSSYKEVDRSPENHLRISRGDLRRWFLRVRRAARAFGMARNSNGIPGNELHSTSSTYTMAAISRKVIGIKF
ncbi:MAG: hypothetical protein P8Y80_05125, partial [Acidobacteriota bacterium]